MTRCGFAKPAAALAVLFSLSPALTAQRQGDEELLANLIERMRRYEQLMESVSLTATINAERPAFGQRVTGMSLVRSGERSYVRVTGESPRGSGASFDMQRAFDGAVSTALSTMTGPDGELHRRAATGENDFGRSFAPMSVGVSNRIPISELLTGETERLAEEYPEMRRLARYELQVGPVRLEELPAATSEEGGAGAAGGGEGEAAGEAVPVYSVRLRWEGGENRPPFVETLYFHRDESHAGPLAYERTFQFPNGREGKFTTRLSDWRDVGGGVFLPFVTEGSGDFGGRGGFSTRVEITELELDPSVWPDLFRIEFPPGVPVDDRVAHLRYTTGAVGLLDLEELAEVPPEAAVPGDLTFAAGEGTAPPEAAEAAEPPAAAEDVGSEPPPEPEPGTGGVSPMVLAIVIPLTILATILIIALLLRRALG